MILPMINAVETLGTFQKDECIDLVQICDNCTSNNISYINYPNGTKLLLNTEMTKDNTYYNYTFCNTTSLGNYVVNGLGDLDGVITVWNYDFDVTYTGEKVSLSNIILALIYIIMSLVFLALAFSFSKDHWIIKTFFNFCAILMGILALNTGKIIASESMNLSRMGEVGLTVMYAVISIFFLYIFIFMFIDVIKTMKNKKEIRWNYD